MLPKVWREAAERHEALARRGEIVQALTASEVTRLEIDAQSKSHMPTVRTFAAVADIHARPIPQGVQNTEYRPGAVGLDMPSTLVGHRSLRVERARDFSARADAVVDKTRNLITLEAEDGYLKWAEATRKVAQTREAAEAGTRLAKHTREDFRSGQKVKIEDLLTNEVIVGQARAAYNEARFQLLLALAATLLALGTLGAADVGDAAPTFESVDDAGKPWKSADHFGKKIVVVYFYPADFTGGCTAQACGFRDDMDKLKGKDVEVIGVSGDSAKTHEAFKKFHKLNFTLLADLQLDRQGKRAILLDDGSLAHQRGDTPTKCDGEPDGTFIRDAPCKGPCANPDESTQEIHNDRDAAGQGDAGRVGNKAMTVDHRGQHVA